MENKEVITPSEEVKNTPADLINNEAEKSNELKEEVVPLATFLELKNESKQAKKEISELKKMIEEGATKKEISQSIKNIAAEHNVDADFLQKLTETIKAQVSEESEKKLSSRLKPIEEKEQQDKINAQFNDVWTKLIEENPEYENIANKEVIKALSLDPNNKNKPFNKILEDAYGHLIKGKKTFDATPPGRGKEELSSIDYSQMNNPEYYNRVMDNPKLKSEYFENRMKNL